MSWFCKTILRYKKKNRSPYLLLTSFLLSSHLFLLFSFLLSFFHSFSFFFSALYFFFFLIPWRSTTSSHCPHFFSLFLTPSGQPAVIVPIGLNYLEKDSFRSEVFVEYGKPIDPRDYLNDDDGTHKLTLHLENAIKACTINTDSWETLKLIETGNIESCNQKSQNIFSNNHILRFFAIVPSFFFFFSSSN